MKVSIDVILNNATEMKDKKNINEEPSKKDDRHKIKLDSLEIRGRLASRLGIIQTELKNLQSSLTKNQIIEENIILLKDEYEKAQVKGDKNSAPDVKFKNPVLNDFLGKNITYEKILQGSERVGELIETDIANIKCLQVEIENIVASNIMDSEISKTVSEIENSLLNINISSLSRISDLRPEMVMSLIR